MFHLFKKSGSDFKFREPESSSCIACKHVVSKKKPVLYVTHDKENGVWQFLCGDTEHANDTLHIISLKQVCKVDPTVNELYEVPIGFGAERKTVKDEWVTFQMEPKVSLQEESF